MTQYFRSIGLIGKPDHEGANQTLTALHDWLVARGNHVLVESKVASQLPLNNAVSASLNEIGQQADLAIVVGGDGNMLGAARVLCRHDIAVIGVNRGNLGFLTDLDPEDFQTPLQQVLMGEFDTEYRFLLGAKIYRDGVLKCESSAMNEVVLHPGKIAHMLEFEVYIDDSLMLGLRADGIIMATPTGSTAYSLSGGGPILTPNLEAIALVPMYPHTLSTRPVVVGSESQIKLKISPENNSDMLISCDSHIALTVLPGDEIIITKQVKRLRLVHPKDYRYFNVLRRKLGWGSKLF
jgi:NAD+ kinase